MRNKKGVVIVIESEKGIKFGAFFSVQIAFTNGILESHFDNHAFLFNISSKKIFPNKNKTIQSVHTKTKTMGLHPTIFFANQTSNLED